jgi:hypothetical protein
MQFAIVEFDSDGSVDVVDSSKILCDKPLECGSSVIVPYKTKKGSDSYRGTVLSLHGKYYDLTSKI